MYQHQWKSSSSEVNSLCSFECGTAVTSQVACEINTQLLSLSARSTFDDNGANYAQLAEH